MSGDLIARIDAELEQMPEPGAHHLADALESLTGPPGWVNPDTGWEIYVDQWVADAQGTDRFDAASRSEAAVARGQARMRSYAVPWGEPDAELLDLTAVNTNVRAADVGAWQINMADSPNVGADEREFRNPRTEDTTAEDHEHRTGHPTDFTIGGPPRCYICRVEWRAPGTPSPFQIQGISSRFAAIGLAMTRLGGAAAYVSPVLVRAAADAEQAQLRDRALGHRGDDLGEPIFDESNAYWFTAGAHRLLTDLFDETEPRGRRATRAERRFNWAYDSRPRRIDEARQHRVTQQLRHLNQRADRRRRRTTTPSAPELFRVTRAAANFAAGLPLDTPSATLILRAQADQFTAGFRSGIATMSSLEGCAVLDPAVTR